VKNVASSKAKNEKAPAAKKVAKAKVEKAPKASKAPKAE